MANRTVKDAKSVRGTNPQFLIEKIIRSRIYECKFWKEECFALSAELIVDKAMELRYIGGVFGGNIKPTPFLCLILKMLQIQPEKDIIVEFIKNEEFKYVRALGAMYMRLVGTSIEIYKYLEPLLNDGRKLRMQGRDGQFQLLHMDEYIDGLLHDERQFDIILPRIQKRHVLEETNELEARVSALEDDADENAESSEEEEEKQAEKRKRSPLRSKEMNERKEKKREKEKREKERKEEKHRERSRSRSRERRHRSRTPDRRQERKEERKRHHDRDRYDRDDHRHERDDRYEKNDRYERDDRDRYDREDRDRHRRDDRDRYDRDSRDDRRRDRDKR